MLLLSIALASLIQPQDAKITFDAPAAPCSRLLPALGKSMGIALEPGISTRDDVVYIHVKDVSSSELLKRISTTLNADWIPMSGGFRLVRSSQAVKQEQKKEELERINYWREVQKSLPGTKSNVALTPTDATKLAELLLSVFEEKGPETRPEQLRRLIDSMPRTIVLFNLVRTLPPQELASLETAKSITYSSSPTRMQRLMTPAMQGIINQFVENEAVWKSAYEQAAIKRFGKDGGQHFSAEVTSDEAARPTISLFTLKKFGPKIALDVKVGRIGEKCLVEASTGIPLTDPENLGSGEINKNEHSVAMPTPEEWKEFRPSSGGNVINDHKKLKSRLLIPEKYEPQGFFLSPFLREAAIAEQCQMVSYLADDYSCDWDNRLFRGEPGEITATRFLNELGGTQIHLEKGWITIKPEHPHSSRLNHINRATLGAYLRATFSDEPMSLEDRSLYAFVNVTPKRQVCVPNSLYRDLLNRQQVLDLEDDEEWNRFYGSLSPGQRQQAISADISLSQLSDDSRSILKNLALNDQSGLMRSKEHDARAIQDGEIKTSEPLVGILEEPSQSIYDGLGAAGSLRLIESLSFAVRVEHELQYILEAEDLAGLQELEQLSDKFVPIGIRKVHILVRYNEIAEQTAILRDSYPIAGEAVPYSKLPEAFRKRVKEIKKMKEDGTFPVEIK